MGNSKKDAKMVELRAGDRKEDGRGKSTMILKAFTVRTSSKLMRTTRMIYPVHTYTHNNLFPVRPKKEPSAFTTLYSIHSFLYSLHW